MMSSAIGKTCMAGSATILVVCLTLSGCGRHPKATTRESLDLIKQVYTACNTKNIDRLTACEKRFAELRESGKLSDNEAASFQKAIGLAKDSKWQQAQDLALRFAQDQVR